MKRPCLFLLILVLTGVLGPEHKGIAKQRPDAVLDLKRKSAPSLSNFRSAMPAEQLPNGASSIIEAYGNWVVQCRLVDGQKQCVFLQVLSNSQTKQRVFQIELRTPSDGPLEGMILMPFGLKLDSGAVLKLDDKDFGEGLRFFTCVPQGCLLPVLFPMAAVDAMKTAKTLTVASLNFSNGELVWFAISMDGFAKAIARVAELGR